MNSQSRSQKIMSHSLKANFLFIRHHWNVNEDCYQRNLDMKGDFSLSDLKNKKNIKVLKKQLSTRNRFFL